MDGVEQWSRRVTTETCLAALNKHGVPSSAYRTVAEALRDPQIAHRGALADVEDGGGTFKVLNLPFRMSGATVAAAKRMSTLGEHTLAYLRETGLSEDENRGLRGKAGEGGARLTPAAFHPLPDYALAADGDSRQSRRPSSNDPEYRT